MPGNANHSFVVRIWFEPREFQNEAVQWRGSIQEVVSGERKYFTKVEEMTSFINRYILNDIQEIKGSEQ